MSSSSAITIIYVPLGTNLSGSYINHKKIQVCVVLLTFTGLCSVEHCSLDCDLKLNRI